MSNPEEQWLRHEGFTILRTEVKVRLNANAARSLDYELKGPDGDLYIGLFHQARNNRVFMNSVLPRSLMLYRAVVLIEGFEDHRLLLGVKGEELTQEETAKMWFGVRNYAPKAELLVTDGDEVIDCSIGRWETDLQLRPECHPEDLIYRDLYLWLDKYLWYQTNPNFEWNHPKVQNPHQLHQAADVSNGMAYKWVRNRRDAGFILDEAPGQFDIVNLQELIETWKSHYSIQDNTMLGQFSLGVRDEGRLSSVCSWLKELKEAGQGSFILTGQAAFELDQKEEADPVKRVDLFFVGDKLPSDQLGPLEESSEDEESDVVVWSPKFEEAVKRATTQTDGGVRVTDTLQQLWDLQSTKTQ